MSEYWKSNAKKFCEICKTWFADNKISIENHERGLKHKAMVQQRLRESGQRAREKDRKESDLRHTLLSMEQAALVSMQKDADNEKERHRISGQAASSSYPHVNAINPREEIRAQKRKLAELKKISKRSQFWSSDGVDSATHQENIDHMHTKVRNLEDGFLQTNTVQWVQSGTGDGQTYYWNIFSGDTRWELPDEPFYTEQQYSEKYAEIASGLAASSIPNNTSEIGEMSVKRLPHKEASSLHDIAPKPEQKSRFEERPSSISTGTLETNQVGRHVKVEVKLEPSISLTEIKHEPVQQLPVEEHCVEYFHPNSSYPLGPWVPVEKPKQKPKLQIDDLPEQSHKQKFSKNPSEVAEEMSLDSSELSFLEKVLPVSDSLSKKGRSKVEFKKRTFANKNMRSRTND